MENLINNVITLEDDEKFLVMNQAIYKEKNYYFVVKVTDDEQDIEDDFRLLEEVIVDGEKAVDIVTDPSIIDLLTKYFQPKEENAQL